ncbi:MAG: hypothetical protein U1C46_05040 [Bacteroidales bacterium]|nr:hypothetical protein [Bacteroidales bacterium]
MQQLTEIIEKLSNEIIGGLVDHIHLSAMFISEELRRMNPPYLLGRNTWWRSSKLP